jgi:Divergent InlB B-repeat domain
MLYKADTHTASLHSRFLPILLALGSVLAFGSQSAHAQIITVSCGTEGGVACTNNNPEYFANNTEALGKACDYGLQQSGNTCVNSNRHTLSDYRQDPVGKVLHDQLYSAQADQPLNWDVFLGTHNSFSSYRSDLRQTSFVPYGLTIPFVNFQIGFTPGILADQELSITDQLASGARFLVIHPHYYLGQLRACHENFSDSVELDVCFNETQGRLFSYIVQEIATWLNDNPGEFVVLRLYHDVGPTYAADLAQILNTYLGPKIFKPDYISWQNGGFPSLRQLRSQGQQIMIIGTESDSASSDPGLTLTTTMWDWSTVVMDDGYTDATGWNSCQNTAGNSVPARAKNMFAFVAEDRSGSNAMDQLEVTGTDIKNGIVQYYNDVVNFFTGGSSSSAPSYNPGGIGLLQPDDVHKAETCSYGLIGLDFWKAGSFAYKGQLGPIGFDYTFPDPDQRQAAALWTFGAYNSTPAFTGPSPVSTDGLSGWNPDNLNGGNNAYPFLCASLGAQNGLPPDRSNGIGWLLQITPNSGSWGDGESSCQVQFGPAWHFWAPETPAEQDLVISRMATNPQKTWLNMKIVPPGQRPPLVVTPSIVKLYWSKGQPMPSLPYIFTKGGTGGSLSAQVLRGNGETQNFLSVTNTGSTFNATFNSSVSQLSAGVHTDQIFITENDPAWGVLSYALPVQLEIDEPLTASAATVALGNCSNPVNASVTLSSGGPFTIRSTQSWLQVTASATQTPATLTFSFSPAGLTPGNYSAVATVTGAYATNSSVSIKVNLTIDPETTIASAPPGLSLLVDGTSMVTPKTYCWATNSDHTVSAPTGIAGAGGNGVAFSRWSDGGAATHSVHTQVDISTLTAEYGAAYQVTLIANPPAGGTVTGAGWYAQGLAAPIRATANAGFTFAGFTGPQDWAQSSFNYPVTGPVTITANFTTPGALLFAITSGERVDGSSPGTRLVPLAIDNPGNSGFGDVRITAIDGFTTVSGSGAASCPAAFPALLGNLTPGGSGSVSVPMNWPATASRLKFTVHFTANGGSYSGSTTLTVNR